MLLALSFIKEVAVYLPGIAANPCIVPFKSTNCVFTPPLFNFLLYSKTIGIHLCYAYFS